MFRTFCATISVSGVTFAKQHVVLKAEEPAEKPWMAEPLTDANTRQRMKNSMRVRMELMCLQVSSVIL